MEFPQYKERLVRPAAAKNHEFQDDGKLLHLINAAQLTPSLILSLIHI